MCAYEIWKAIPGFEGFYEASNLGFVRSVARRVKCKGGTRSVTSRVLKSSPDKDGYHIVSLSASTGRQKSFRLAGVILTTFIGPRPFKLEACHFDGNPDHNDLSNLRWDTGKSNWADRRRHGRGVEGAKNPNYKGTATCTT